MIYTPGFSRKTMLIFKFFIEFFIDYGIKEFGENKSKKIQDLGWKLSKMIKNKIGG